MNAATTGSDDQFDAYWAMDPSALEARVESTAQGLSSAEAAVRLRKYGLNTLDAQRALSRTNVLLNHMNLSSEGFYGRF